MRLPILSLFTILFCYILQSQPLSGKKITSLTDKNFQQSVLTLREFLEMPNYGRDEAQIDQNLDWCQKRIESLGFLTQIIVSKGVKHLFAERTINSELKTLLIYMQIDGQPVDSAAWDQESPFLPVVKDCSGSGCIEVSWDRLKEYHPDWKLFARSASDSKGPAMAFMEALRILDEQKINPTFNIKVILDFQEELGSPTLPALVEANQELMAADAILIMDGTRHPSNLPTLTYGARGIATMKLTVYGANKDLHSGQYGNFAPNPAFALARLLAGMKDETGKVLIPGYYEGVNLTEAFKQQLNNLPEDQDELLRKLGLSQSEAVGDTYQEALQYPSFNIRGMRAGWTDEQVRTIIPAEATAEIDMRLVTETHAERQIALVTAFIRSQGYHIIDSLPTEEERLTYPKLIQISSRVGSRPFKTPLDSPLGITLGEAMDRTFGPGKYIRMQATGGSQPIAPFITTMNIPAISIRIPNPDNSIHAPNENLRLGNYHEGIRMCLGILTQEME